MDILIVHASKHGSTVGIAQSVAARLIERGHAVTIYDAESADQLDRAVLERCDAVVLGSAIYGGHWLKPARRFVDRHLTLLEEHPVWLFSSGPLGDHPEPEDDPIEVQRLIRTVGACEHRIFPGALDRDDLNVAERAMVKVVRAPYGDFRDADAVRAWADEIADTLAVPATAPS